MGLAKSNKFEKRVEICAFLQMTTDEHTLVQEAIVSKKVRVERSVQ